MRLLGLDVGDVRIGVSISDPTATISRSLCILDSRKSDVFNELSRIIKDNHIITVVYGIPISLDGTKKRQVEKVEMFIDKLKKTINIKDLNFVSVDERFTTISASNILNETKSKREYLDDVSASLILQTYLNLKSR
jgi:putative Holliday junction resolvase